MEMRDICEIIVLVVTLIGVLKLLLNPEKALSKDENKVYSEEDIRKTKRGLIIIFVIDIIVLFGRIMISILK